MDKAAILSRLDKERRSLQRAGEILELFPQVSRLRSADDLQHTIIYSALDSNLANGVIAEQIEHYRRLGIGFEWKVYSYDQPADLLNRLQNAGLEIGQMEAVLVYDLRDPADWMAHDPSLPVVRVNSVEQVASYQDVAEAIFQKKYAFTAGELAADLRGGFRQHRGYIAFAGDVPVGIGRLYTHPQSQFGGLYGGATRNEYRGQGFYRAVLAARARDAIAAGAKYLIVDALPMSRRILERLGFEKIAETWPCAWTP